MIDEDNSETGFYNHAFYKNNHQSNNDFLAEFKKMAKKLKPIQKHFIRKIIYQTCYSTVTSDTVDGKDPKKVVQKQDDAVYLKSCKIYHPHGLEQVSRDFTKESEVKVKNNLTKKLKGQIYCQKCQTFTQSIKDVFADPFAQIYFPCLSNIGTIQISFLDQGEFIGTQVKKQKQMQKADKILIQSNNVTKIYSIFILIRKKDEKNPKEVIDNIQSMIKNPKTLQFQTIQMNNNLNYATNFFCFHQNKRIINPIFHLDCKIEQHFNKLILYSFQYVYEQVKNENEVKCILPNCKNSFKSLQDFIQKAGLLKNFKNQFYQVPKCYLIGNFLRTTFECRESARIKSINKDKNLNFDSGDDKVIKCKNDMEYICDLVIKGANIKNVEKYYSKIHKEFQNNQQKRFVQVQIDTKDFVEVCYTAVICLKCSINTIKIQFLWQIASEFVLKNNKCKFCQRQFKTKAQFNDYVFLDIKFMKFIFLEPKFRLDFKNYKIWYDCQLKEYTISIVNPIGETIKQQVMIYKKISKKKSSVTSRPPKLSNNKSYFALYHQKCQNKINLATHYIIIEDSIKIGQPFFKCPICSLRISITELVYDEYYTNKLRQTDMTQTGYEQKDQSASDLSQLQYKDLPQQKLQFKQNKVKIFYRTYYGQLMSQPVFFKSCNHQLPQTAIIDFEQDVKKKFQKYSRIKCGFNGCLRSYTKNSILYKIKDIPSLTKDQQKQLRSFSNQSFWIEFDCQSNTLRVMGSRSNLQMKKYIQLYRQITDEEQMNYDDQFEKLKKRYPDDYQRYINPNSQNSQSSSTIPLPQDSFKNIKSFGNNLIYTKYQINPVNEL